MKKILVIGQAPPNVKQAVPYDTTMLYIMFGWAGISKIGAQDFFEFEAMSDKFPGYNPAGGHARPSTEDMDRHFEKSLKQKIKDADFILVLGNIARDELGKRGVFKLKKLDQCCFLIHPSYRNAARINKDKEEITRKLKNLFYEYTISIIPSRKPNVQTKVGSPSKEIHDHSGAGSIDR